jgi:hypothetical protein
LVLEEKAWLRRSVALPIFDFVLFDLPASPAAQMLTGERLAVSKSRLVKFILRIFCTTKYTKYANPESPLIFFAWFAYFAVHSVSCIGTYVNHTDAGMVGGFIIEARNSHHGSKHAPVLTAEQRNRMSPNIVPKIELRLDGVSPYRYAL